VWKLNPARSTFVENQKRLTIRIEPHTRGEMLLWTRLPPDGRASTFSTILYSTARPGTIQDSACSGMQSSWRVDGHQDSGNPARMCARRANAAHSRTAQAGVLILEIIEQTYGRPDALNDASSWNSNKDEI